uniref:Uncharacterized protein n=1 Tax=Kalanchoe fedtschenkoi TaxID=63787 RepID=A0A7N0T2J4_KALFE
MGLCRFHPRRSDFFYSNSIIKMTCPRFFLVVHGFSTVCRPLMLKEWMPDQDAAPFTGEMAFWAKLLGLDLIFWDPDSGGPWFHSKQYSREADMHGCNHYAKIQNGICKNM